MNQFTYYFRTNQNPAAPKVAEVIPVTHDAVANTLTLTVKWPNGKKQPIEVSHTWKADRETFDTAGQAKNYIAAKGWAN